MQRHAAPCDCMNARCLTPPRRRCSGSNNVDGDAKGNFQEPCSSYASSGLLVKWSHTGQQQLRSGAGAGRNSQRRWGSGGN